MGEIIGGIIRTALAAAGGGALFTQDEAGAIAGAVIVLGAGVWSAYQKWAKNKKK